MRTKKKTGEQKKTETARNLRISPTASHSNVDVRQKRAMSVHSVFSTWGGVRVSNNPAWNCIMRQRKTAL